MGKLGVFSGAEICKLLAAHGFSEVRRRGSHIIMQLKLAGTTRTVPVPDHAELKQGTLLSRIRQSGVERGVFEK